MFSRWIHWALIGLVLVFLALALAGCSTGIRPALERGVEAAKDLHDDQIVAGETLMCGSSLRAFLARYADDPERFRAALTVCGYKRYFNLIGGVK